VNIVPKVYFEKTLNYGDFGTFQENIMESKVNELLQKPIVVINLGLKKFAESLEGQQVEVLQVDWVPPAGGDKGMMDLLDQLL